jgi:transcriptional regulator with XRE-family HTH domain
MLVQRERNGFLEVSRELSELSAFLKGKIKDKGWSIKRFSEEAGLNDTYCYKLLGEKRDFTPGDDTLEKIFNALDSSDEDRKYVLELAARERDEGDIVYPSDSEPVDEEPGEPSVEPEVPSVPVPVPVKPVPWYRRGEVYAALLVGFVAGILVGGCGVLTVVAGLFESY